MLLSNLNQILGDAQKTSSHQRCLKRLINIYDNTDLATFTKDFMHCLLVLFTLDKTPEHRLHVERCFELCARFCVRLDSREKQKLQNTNPFVEDLPTHPLLMTVIKESIKLITVHDANVRYRTCQMLAIILKHVEDETIDIDTLADIQEALLKRAAHDPKWIVCLQALCALVRLQEPANPCCPVVETFTHRLCDTHAGIRKMVVANIAISSNTLPKLPGLILDVDPLVRAAAIKRVASLSPKCFSIETRRVILKSCLNESNDMVKSVFKNKLLTRWLSYFSDILHFMDCLKFDIDEADINETFTIYTKLVQVLYETRPMQEWIDILSLDSDRLVPINKLTFEMAAYWNLLTNQIRTVNGDDMLLDVMPELVQLCQYIKSFVEQHIKDNQNEVEYPSKEFILNQLLTIAEGYDIDDEFRRNVVRQVTSSILLNCKTSQSITTKVVRILARSINSPDTLSEEICHIISDIREPLVDVPVSADQKREKEFQLAQLRVQLNVLMDQRERAVSREDYVTAAKTSEEINTMKQKIDLMNEAKETKQVRKRTDDVETTCYCLDILISLLQLPTIKTINTCMLTCKNEFVKPLMSNNHPDVFSRILKVILLYSIMDKDMMIQNYDTLMLPLKSYFFTGNFEVKTLLVAADAAFDLTAVYGVEIFNNKGSSNDTTTSSIRNGGRKLYSVEEGAYLDMSAGMSLTYDNIIDILVKFLDHERMDIQLKGTDLLRRFIICGFLHSSTVMSRMLLKWFSPHTDQQVQQVLSHTILHYATHIRGSEEVLEKAVIPAIVCIAKAPNTSPLSDIDTVDALRFLAAITSITTKNKMVSKTHENLAHSIYARVAKDATDMSTPMLIKFLDYLDVSHFSTASVQDLLTGTEKLSAIITDKTLLNKIMKFSSKLKGDTMPENTVAADSMEEGATASHKNSGVNHSKSLETTTERTKGEMTQTLQNISTSECDAKTDKLESKRARRSSRRVQNEKTETSQIRSTNKPDGETDKLGSKRTRKSLRPVENEMTETSSQNTNTSSEPDGEANKLGSKRTSRSLRRVESEMTESSQNTNTSSEPDGEANKLGSKRTSRSLRRVESEMTESSQNTSIGESDRETNKLGSKRTSRSLRRVQSEMTETSQNTSVSEPDGETDKLRSNRNRRSLRHIQNDTKQCVPHNPLCVSLYQVKKNTILSSTVKKNI